MKAVPPIAGPRAGHRPLAGGARHRRRARPRRARQPRADRPPRLLRADRLGGGAGAHLLRLARAAGSSGPRCCTSSSCCRCRSSSTGRSTPRCSSSPREIGVKLVALAGVPVYLEGNVIDLGVYHAAGRRGLLGAALPLPDHELHLRLRGALPRAALAQARAARPRRAGGGDDERGPHRHHRHPRRPLRHRPGRGLPPRLRGLGGVSLLPRASCSGWSRSMQRLVGDRRRLGDALDLDFSGLGGRDRPHPLPAGVAGRWSPRR